MAEKKEKQYVSDNAQLMAEWDWEKNRLSGLKPTLLSTGSKQKVWWICGHGHHWQSVISNRTKGAGCPYCAGRKVLIGFNDLQTTNPSLAAEWNHEKNDTLKPEGVTAHSGIKVWWKCIKGHEWQATIDSRSNGYGCPYCAGQKAISGVNDLQTVNPALALEWNYEKNVGITPCDIAANSHKTVWWKCSEGHEWQAKIDNRNKGRSCPYCSGQKVLKGYNDLQTINPTLASEWNYIKNGDLKPEFFTANSGDKVWWKCGEGHEWQATIGNRNSGTGCPYCAGQKVLSGFNDLQTVNPTVSREWSYERNNVLTPKDIVPFSDKIVWWKCSKGHEWKAAVKDRSRGTGCPVCASERHTSFPEYAIVYYLTKSGLDVIHSYKEMGYELDIYIPSKKIAIEYDGSYWHQNKTKQDLDKNLKCQKDGIQLYRIREGLLPLNDSSIDYIVQDYQKDLQKVLSEILYQITDNIVDVNLARDTIDIENLREYTEKEKSLLSSNPEVAKEWNYERNGNLKPENFTAKSSKKVWWKCGKGHEWQATIADRNNGRGCPYCAGQKVLIGVNDLLTINPALVAEWNHVKNGNLKPEHFTANSKKQVWWICDKGHEWQATICNRNKDRGCPYCAGRKIYVGFNDLHTVNPNLAAEWNYSKNGNLAPHDFTAKSSKKVWWKCSEGHEWQAIIASRNSGRGCPKCAGKKRWETRRNAKK